MVTIPAGVTSADFSLSIRDDDALEDDETFTLTINSSSTPDGVSGGPATVTIVDDDRKLLCLWSIHALFSRIAFIKALYNIYFLIAINNFSLASFQFVR